MEIALLTLNIIVLCMSTMSTVMQLNLIKEIRTFRTGHGTSTSSIIMRRYLARDTKNDPFLGFRCVSVKTCYDLTGFGAGAGGNSDPGLRRAWGWPSKLSLSSNGSVAGIIQGAGSKK